MGDFTPYYQDRLITIYHGDSREILPTLGTFDLLLSDPPYGTENGAGYGRKQNHGGEGRTIANDGDLTVAREVCTQAASQIYKGYAALFCSGKKVKEAVDLIPHPFIGELIWDKGSPGMGHLVRYAHESCLLWRVGEPLGPVEPLMSIVRNHISRVDTGNRHPHEKPVNFWLNALRLPGDRVIDPFMGSGTVLRACRDMGRLAVGIEIDERWCEDAALRQQQEVFAL